MKGEEARIPLATKTSPTQERSRSTFEAIIAATGDLLGEVGIERLSTNLIAARTGITAPALYRYFPNKYAILRVMGERIMEIEDSIVLDMLGSGSLGAADSFADAVRANVELMRRTREAVRAMPGSLWILRAMRAVPTLRETREQSTSMVATSIFTHLADAWPEADRARLKSAALLTTTLMTAANEAVLDNPDLDESFTQETARLIALYFRDVLSPRKPPS